MLQQFLQKFSRGSGANKPLLVFHLFSDKVRILTATKAKRGWQLNATEQMLGAAPFPDNLQKILAAQAKAGSVAVVLAPELYQIVPLDKPNLPSSAEIVQALPWLIKDLCTLAPEDMQVDYIDLANTSSAVAKINVVVASRAMLKPLCALLQQAKLTPDSIVPEEWLSLQLVPSAGPTRMILQQQAGHDLILQVVRDGQLCFNRHLRGFSVLPQLPLTQIAAGLFDNLLLEVQRSMDFVEAQLKLPPVREVVLLLAHPELPAIAGLFQQAGFNQAQVAALPAHWSWAAALDVPLYWPAIVAMAGLMQATEVVLETAG